MDLGLQYEMGVEEVEVKIKSYLLKRISEL
jgi:hypothetical protein